ncbi:MAG: putative maltokinase, partial [Bacteroidales bacterium]
PMQWSADRNAGFSSAEPQRLYLPIIFNHDYHYETINVENNEKNPSSLLWWMRRVIATRKQYKAFSRGDIEFIETNNSKILAFTRKYEDEIILVIINLSRYSQQAKLDLSEYSGYIPTEIFSRNEFTPIEERPYDFPLQFKNYFWFELRKPEEEEEEESMLDYQLSLSAKQWNQMSETTVRSVKKLLQEYIQKNRWFRGKSKKLKDLKITDRVTLVEGKLNSYLLIFETTYFEGKNDQYVMPLSIILGEEMLDIKYHYPESVISFVEIDGHDGMLYDGSYDSAVRDTFMKMIVQRNKIRNRNGELAGVPVRRISSKISKSELPFPSKVLGVEQSNTSLLYNNRFFFKMYRSPEEGDNPELEIIKALTEKTSFHNFPTFTGSLEYRRKDSGNIALGLLVDFIPNQGNAWEFTQHAIERYFDRIREDRENLMAGYDEKTTNILKKLSEEKKDELLDPFFLEMIGLLGKRTAEMHLALASIKGNKNFEEEPFSLLYQKSLYQSFRTLIKRTISEMKSSRRKLDDDQKELVNDIIKKEPLMLNTIKQTLEKKKIRTTKTRIHGDYHLGQVLFTGKDFVIIDFEGEPTRSLTARSLKYCPLKDVAGMLRSFHYAIYMGELEYSKKIPESSEFLEPWLEAWYQKIYDTFMDHYLETAGMTSFIPEEKRQLNDLLSVYTIEKAIYEADYELNNRPDWLRIPLNGLTKILGNLTAARE